MRLRVPLVVSALLTIMTVVSIVLLNRSIGVRRSIGWFDYAARQLIEPTTLSESHPDVREHLVETRGWRRAPVWPERFSVLSEGLRPKQIMDWSVSLDGSVAALSTKRRLFVSGERETWDRSTVGTKNYPAGKVAVSEDGSMIAVVVEGNHVIVCDTDDGVILTDFEAQGSDAVSLLRWGPTASDLFVGRRTLRGPAVTVEHWRIGP